VVSLSNRLGFEFCYLGFSPRDRIDRFEYNI